MEWKEAIILIAVAIFLLYKYGSRKFNYWTKKGVRQLSPVPFIGDHYKNILQLEDPIKTLRGLTNKFKGERFGGIYFFQTPFLMVVDPELLKQIMVKDADHFLNRYDWSMNADELMSKNLSFLKGEKWKKLRNVMTTVFTTSKMKDMFTFMEKCARQSTLFMEEKFTEQKITKEHGKPYYDLECKDFFSCYGTDVIASTAFGYEINSFKNPNNEFRNAGKKMGNLFSGLNTLKFMILLAFPTIAKKLKISMFGSDMNNFFISVVKNAIRNREENNIVRKDVIHILMEARKEIKNSENENYVQGKLPDFSDVDIAAQAMLFFFGGFETMAGMLAFAAYELAINQEIQEKLFEEIKEVVSTEKGVTYEGVIHKMHYLEMVISEVLRKWPPALMTDRKVTKSYTIPKTESSPEILLTEHDNIWVNILGIHYDEKHYPNPEKFDPERFSNDKANIKPFTFLPFGSGLRHCIAMRYALMEAKTILVHLLLKFKIVPTEKSIIPMELSSKSGFMLKAKNGFWFGLQLRA